MDTGLPSWCRFGSWEDPRAATGLSLFLFPERACAAVAVAGFATGTRHLDRLLVDHPRPLVDGILLTGGSAYGMGAADGVLTELRAAGRGEPIRGEIVPIVPTAVIFDLFVGSAAWPGAEAGKAAVRCAGERVPEGCRGAGTGASIGKLTGLAGATKSGAGWSAEQRSEGFWGVYAVVNAFGDVYDPDSGRLLAGLRADPGRFRSTLEVLCDREPAELPGENTTLVVALLEGAYSAVALRRIAHYLAASLRVVVRPSHTAADGDVVFVAASGRGATIPTMAAAARLERHLWQAVVRAVERAEPGFGLPTAEEWRHAA